MRIRLIVSPAKKMNIVEGPPYATAAPFLLNRAVVLAHQLGSLSFSQSKALWRCSDKLARLNYARTRTLEADMQQDPALLTPAILAFEGIQYQHMAPQVMTDDQIAWLQGSLRVLSGLYGVLRPLDGVVPYRLEMQALLSVGNARNLYSYWDSTLYQRVIADDDPSARDNDVTIVNLASVEYAKAVVPFAQRAGTPVVTCLFGTIRPSDGRLIQKATEAKAARGTMTRWCAEHAVGTPDELRGFAERGYKLSEANSSETRLVFVRES
ncbi:MAG: peroxide stress protein YaaA [Tractidigestivibacter sp.]|jgi:cytoplasmic iron level regulating protein YaaA (DUF328/UPF0246 family)|uniref:peroxide stress protein YaaA n=1 Tax=Tractidigestivibacter sp. TaxID=2847320 RepID=UPI003D904631